MVHIHFPAGSGEQKVTLLKRNKMLVDIIHIIVIIKLKACEHIMMQFIDRQIQVGAGEVKGIVYK